MAQACAAASSPNYVPHPLLLIHRLDTINAYHNLEYVTMTFVALAVLQRSGSLDPSAGLQVGVSQPPPLRAAGAFTSRPPSPNTDGPAFLHHAVSC